MSGTYSNHTTSLKVSSLLYLLICKHSLVINAVLIVDVQQLVFDPTDLLGRLFPSLVVQAVFLIKLSQAHHGLLTHTPLKREEK